MEIEKGEDSTDPTVASLLIGKRFMGFHVWATIVKLRVKSHLLFPKPKCYGKGHRDIFIWSIQHGAKNQQIYIYNIPGSAMWVD